MKLFFCWMTWGLSVLTIANVSSQASERLAIYTRSLENGLLLARTLPRQGQAQGLGQRAQDTSVQAQSNPTAIREYSSPSTRDNPAGRWRSPSPSGSLSDSSRASSRSSSRSLSPLGPPDPALPLPTAQGAAFPPFSSRSMRDGRPGSPVQVSDGGPRRNLVVGQRQAAINLRTMRHEETGATGRAALMAVGHDLAKITVDTHDGGTGYIQADPQTRLGSPGRFIPSGVTSTMSMGRRNPMREMTVAGQVNGPGRIIAEAKNPGLEGN